MKLGTPIKIHAEIKSPVFIWNGDVPIKPLSFLIEGNKVHVLNVDRFLHALGDKERRAYLDWLEPIIDVIAKLDDQLKQAKHNDNRKKQIEDKKREYTAKLNIETFIRERLGKSSPVDFVRQLGCIAYSVNWDVKPREDGFRPCIKTMTNQPYVPGSEIKGAIRTALLFTLLEDTKRYEEFRELVSKARPTLKDTKKRKEALDRIATQLEAKLLRPKSNDAKFDLMKLIAISDGTPLAIESLLIRALESVGTQRYTKTLVECLGTGQRFDFSLALPTQDSVWAFQSLGVDSLVQNYLSLDKLFEACYLHSKAILEMEAEYFANDSVLRQRIQHLQADNQPKAPLLRLGSGQGFLSVTVDYHLRQRHPNLYEVIREAVSEQRNWRRTVPNNFPKTRRTVTDGRRNPKDLLGWIKLTRG